MMAGCDSSGGPFGVVSTLGASRGIQACGFGFLFLRFGQSCDHHPLREQCCATRQTEKGSCPPPKWFLYLKSTENPPFTGYALQQKFFSCFSDLKLCTPSNPMPCAWVCRMPQTQEGRKKFLSWLGVRE